MKRLHLWLILVVTAMTVAAAGPVVRGGAQGSDEEQTAEAGVLERSAGSVLERAAAQTDAPAGDTLSAGIYPGDCDQEGGEPEFELRDLAEQEAGEPATPIQTSFTTIGAPLADLLGDQFAILVLGGGEVALCGEIGGGDAETSRYVGLREVNRSGYAGIAWLFARDDETQVSLFVAQGLGAAPPTDGPPPAETAEPGPPEDPTEEPGPPADPTEEPTDEPTAEPTTRATGDAATYVSENYGYSVTYGAPWEVASEETTQDSAGNPVDSLELTTEPSYAAFIGITLRLDPQTCVDNWAAAIGGDEGINDWTPREGPDGEPLAGGDGGSAFAVFDYTATEAGEDVGVSVYLECRTITPGRELLMFTHVTESADFDAESAARDELLAGVRLPGE